jgi:hypothetical protein
MTLCTLMKVYRHFRGTYCLHLQGRKICRSSKKPCACCGIFIFIAYSSTPGKQQFFHRNVGKLLPGYTTSHPRRLFSFRSVTFTWNMFSMVNL